MDTYELIGFITTILCVWLSARENAWGFPIAAIASAFYCVVYYQAKLYLDAGLQIFYIVLSIYGWYHWLYGGEQRRQLRVTLLPRRLLPVLLLVGLLSTAVMGYAVQWVRPDASLPYLDAALTVASLTAQWMLSRKHLENWLVWIVVDPVYVGMYIYKHLYLTAFLYLIITLLAVQGYYQWKKASAIPTV